MSYVFISFIFRLFQLEIWDNRFISFIRRSAITFAGAAEEASTVFGNVASQRLQKTCVAQRINFSEGAITDQTTDSDKASKDASLWQTEHVSGENQQDLKIKQLGADIPPDTDRQHNSSSHTNGWDLNTPSPVLSQVISLS